MTTGAESYSAAVAADPNTPLDVLADIARTCPDLRAHVASNPSTYPALRDWIAQQAPTPALSPVAVAQRRKRSLGLVVAIVAVAGIVLGGGGAFAAIQLLAAPSEIAGGSGESQPVEPEKDEEQAAVEGALSGSILAWGRSQDGELGNGSIGDDIFEKVAVPVTGIDNAVQIVSGFGTAYALLDDGTVWGWGDGARGQLGSTEGSPVPVRIPGLDGVTALAASGWGGYALAEDGQVLAWGWGQWGLLGDGQSGEDHQSSVPTAVTGIDDAVAIGADSRTAFAVRADGTLLSWGMGDGGALGNGTFVEEATEPVEVEGLENIVSVVGGDDCAYALDADGDVWAWGRADNARLGTDLETWSAVPSRISGLENIVAVARGGPTGFALDEDGRVWSWGFFAALGTGSTETVDSSTPVLVDIPAEVTSIAGGAGTGYALDVDGVVWMWGDDSYSGITPSNRAEPDPSVPTEVPGINRAIAVFGGYLAAYVTVR